MYCGESDAGSDSNLCYELFSVYRVNKNSVLTSVYLGTSTRNESNLLGILDTLPRIQIERQDFQNKFFRSGIVVSKKSPPVSFNGLWCNVVDDSQNNISPLF